MKATIFALAFASLTACSTTPSPPADAGVQTGTSSVAEVVTVRAQAAPDAPVPILTVHFSPSGGCTDAIVRLIQSSTVRVHLMAYSFTSQPVVNALIAAKKAGREVVVVLDKSDTRSPKVKVLRAAGVPVYIDSKHAIMHDKVTIVDKDHLMTGSFNYTFAAENANAENCLRVDEAAGIVESYEANFQLHKGHALAVR